MISCILVIPQNGKVIAFYPPLFYRYTKPKGIHPNKSAIAAIREACLRLTIQYLYNRRLLAKLVAGCCKSLKSIGSLRLIKLGSKLNHSVDCRTVLKERFVIDAATVVIGAPGSLGLGATIG